MSVDRPVKARPDDDYEEVLARLEQAKGRTPPATEVGGGRRSLRLRPVCELMADPQPPAWLVKGWLELDTFALVFGEPGVGKSFVAIDLACSVATGIDWHDQVVRKGVVFYIAGEGGNGMGRRFRAWQLKRGIDLADAPLHVSTVPASLSDIQTAAEAVSIVEHYEEEHGMPVLIVIDTLARNFGPGDENSTKDMTSFVNACDWLREMTGACVLLVHHCGHADKKRARGSTALKGALDWEYKVIGDSGAINMICTKAKDAEPPAFKAFRLESVDLGYFDEDGEDVTSAALTPALAMQLSVQGKTGRGKNQQLALRVLKEALKQAEDYLASERRNPEEAWVPLDVWRDRCANDRLEAKRFSEVSRNLAKQGFVLIENGRVTLQDPEFAMPI